MGTQTTARVHKFGTATARIFCLSSLSNKMESLGEVVGDGTVAKEIHAGLPPKRRKAVPVASPADIDSFKAQWGGKSVWAMWSAGPLHRYHVLHWALAASPAGVGALARFLLHPADADNPLPDAPVDHLVYRWLRGKHPRAG